MEDRIPHAPAKFRCPARPTISSPRVRVLRLVRNTLWERERRLMMRPKRSPLNRAWSRCPVIIVSSTSITSSARGVQQHTLSVKSTGRVEKEPVSGKNGHHHRDRDGRIDLGRSTPDIAILSCLVLSISLIHCDIAIKSVCHTQSVSQTPLFCRGDRRSYLSEQKGMVLVCPPLSALLSASLSAP